MTTTSVKPLLTRVSRSRRASTVASRAARRELASSRAAKPAALSRPRAPEQRGCAPRVSMSIADAAARAGPGCARAAARRRAAGTCVLDQPEAVGARPVHSISSTTRSIWRSSSVARVPKSASTSIDAEPADLHVVRDAARAARPRSTVGEMRRTSDDVVGDQPVSARDQVERRLALADAALPEDQDAETVHLDEVAVQRASRGASRSSSQAVAARMKSAVREPEASTATPADSAGSARHAGGARAVGHDEAGDAGADHRRRPPPRARRPDRASRGSRSRCCPSTWTRSGWSCGR